MCVYSKGTFFIFTPTVGGSLFVDSSLPQKGRDLLGFFFLLNGFFFIELQLWNDKHVCLCELVLLYGILFLTINDDNVMRMACTEILDQF